MENETSTGQSVGKACPACAAGAPKTYDGRHHPGFNGKRFYSCRARDSRPQSVSLRARSQSEVDAFAEADIDARIAESCR